MENERDGADLCYKFIQEMMEVCARHRVTIDGINDGKKQPMWFNHDSEGDPMRNGFIIDLGSIQDLVNSWKETA